MKEEKGLNYIFDCHTKLVILGTFPSEKSRNECYYNNPQNQFWKIMAVVCNNDKIAISADKIDNNIEKQKLYNLRYKCLQNKNIGLWDVVAKCRIKGSNDKDINRPLYNDFAILKQNCPQLKCIVFNSKNAKKLFGKYLKQENNEELKEWLLKLSNNGDNVLPSTSSANARTRPEEKLEKWKKFLQKYI